VKRDKIVQAVSAALSTANIKNNVALFGGMGKVPPLSNMKPMPLSTYEPVWIVDIWEGPLPGQGRFIGMVRIPSAHQWAARVVKVPHL
jgi:hypothetical protein